MSKQHTKEPWGINDWPQPDNSIGIGAVGTPLIARVILRDVSINAQKANARRIVACVNACAGLSTEELESYQAKNLTDGLMLIAVKQERDDLLAALEGVAAFWDSITTEDRLNDLHAKARDTIASVKGGAA